MKLEFCSGSSTSSSAAAGSPWLPAARHVQSRDHNDYITLVDFIVYITLIESDDCITWVKVQFAEVTEDIAE
jgi:hypothetical protein